MTILHHPFSCDDHATEDTSSHLPMPLVWSPPVRAHLLLTGAVWHSVHAYISIRTTQQDSLSSVTGFLGIMAASVMQASKVEQYFLRLCASLYLQRHHSILIYSTLESLHVQLLDIKYN